MSQKRSIERRTVSIIRGSSIGRRQEIGDFTQTAPAFSFTTLVPTPTETTLPTAPTTSVETLEVTVIPSSVAQLEDKIRNLQLTQNVLIALITALSAACLIGLLTVVAYRYRRRRMQYEKERLYSKADEEGHTLPPSYYKPPRKPTKVVRKPRPQPQPPVPYLYPENPTSPPRRPPVPSIPAAPGSKRLASQMPHPIAMPSTAQELPAEPSPHIGRRVELKTPERTPKLQKISIPKDRSHWSAMDRIVREAERRKTLQSPQSPQSPPYCTTPMTPIINTRIANPTTIVPTTQGTPRNSTPYSKGPISPLKSPATITSRRLTDSSSILEDGRGHAIDRERHDSVPAFSPKMGTWFNTGSTGPFPSNVSIPAPPLVHVTAPAPQLAELNFSTGNLVSPRQMSTIKENSHSGLEGSGSDEASSSGDETRVNSLSPVQMITVKDAAPLKDYDPRKGKLEYEDERWKAHAEGSEFVMI